MLYEERNRCDRSARATGGCMVSDPDRSGGKGEEHAAVSGGRGLRSSPGRRCRGQVPAQIAPEERARLGAVAECMGGAGRESLAVKIENARIRNLSAREAATDLRLSK